MNAGNLMKDFLLYLLTLPSEGSALHRGLLPHYDKKLIRPVEGRPYQPPPPPPPPPPPEEPPPPLPELEPGAVDEEEIASEKEEPNDEAKPAAEKEFREEPEYHTGPLPPCSGLTEADGKHIGKLFRPLLLHIKGKRIGEVFLKELGSAV